MKEVINKHQKWILWVVCIAAVVGGGIYYFGIQNAFMPNGEDLWRVQRWYTILHYGQRYIPSNVVTDAITFFSVSIGGMSYFSLRLDFTLCYMIILGLSLYLSIAGRGNRKAPWYMIPLWAFLMVFLFVLRTGFDFSVGRVDNTGLVNVYPFNYHVASLIFAFLCMIFLQSFLDATKKMNKIVIGILGAVVLFYGAKHTDLIYYVIFALPGMIVLGLHCLQNHKTRKFVLPAIAAGAAVLLVTSLLPADLKTAWWGTEPMTLYDSGIYGGTNWFDVDDLFHNLTRYIKVVLELFNIQLADRPMISLYSVLFVIRIAFVVIGYKIVAGIIRCSVKGITEQSGYNVTDEILAWAYVILSCTFLFTGFGVKEDGITRYYSALVPILTILLCRHLGNTVESVLPACKQIKYKRFYFAGIVAILCFCQKEPVGTYDAEDQYEADCRAAVEYVKQWAGDDEEIYVVAPYWIAARLSAIAEGDIIFGNNERYLRTIYGTDAAAKYVIIGWENRWFKIGVDDLVGHSYEEMCENYKIPLREVQLDSFYVFEFADE